MPKWFNPAAAICAAMFAFSPLVIANAPYESTMGLVQKIFYYHMPSAWIFLISAIVCGVASARYLVGGSARQDRIAWAAAELTFLFGAVALVTGCRELAQDVVLLVERVVGVELALGVLDDALALLPRPRDGGLDLGLRDVLVVVGAHPTQVEGEEHPSVGDIAARRAARSLSSSWCSSGSARHWAPVISKAAATSAGGSSSTSSITAVTTLASRTWNWPCSS